MFVNDKILILITLNVLIIISDLIRLGAGRENNVTAAEAHAFVAFVTTLRIIFPLLLRLRLRRLGSHGALATVASLCLRCRCVAFLLKSDE